MKSIFTLAGLIILSTALCSVAQAQKVTAGFDEKANFNNYKTFAFDKSGARNPFVNKLIVEAVERELTARGFSKVTDNSDLLVVYLAATGPNLQVSDVPFYHVVNPVYSGMVFSATSTMWDVTTGTLVIDLFDVKAERTVFRGSASDVLQRAPSADLAADAKLVSKTVSKSVTKIFKKYPVKTK